jgi:hypothetical protein
MPEPAHLIGFSVTVADADREIRAMEKGLALLPDWEATYHE